MCGRLDEDGAHPLLMKWKEVRGVWRELNLEEVRCDLTSAESARAMMERVLKLKPEVQNLASLDLVGGRNKWREEGRRRTAMEIVYVTAAQTEKTNKQMTARLLSDSRQISQCCRPGQGEAKINSDGAFFSSSGDGGWDFVLRDEEGTIVKADGGREDHLQYAFHAELLGCVAGLRNAVELGITAICLETDAGEDSD